MTNGGVLGNSPIKILFLSADPTDATKIRLGQELRDIRERLQLSRFRDRFLLESRESIRPGDISQVFFDVKPQIVHFAGHGKSTGELCVEDILGKTNPIKPNALAELFKLLTEHINCVVLNACYSEIQARAIAQHIPYVIGMSKEIADQAAIAFYVGFYEALGANYTIEEAFNFGRVKMKILGVSEDISSVLHMVAFGVDNLDQITKENACDRNPKYHIGEQILPTPSKLPIEQKETNENRCGYAIVGSIEQVDLPKLKAIVALLQKMTGDTSIEIVDIEKGSIKLILEGSQQSLEQIEYLFKLGELKDILGVIIEDVNFLEPITLEKDKNVINNKKRLAFTIASNADESDIAKLKAALAVDNLQKKVLRTNSRDSRDLLGTVLAVQANFYRVQLDVVDVEETLPATSLLCTRRTRLKKIGQPVIVGDRVVVEEPDWAGGRGVIADVQPRQSQLDRPAIANVNQILLVFTVADPPIEPYQLSHFLVKAESTGLDIVLCLNKSDLITTQQQEEIRTRLTSWGYQPRFISVSQGINIDQLASILTEKITVVAGPSGVGKSSLINALIPRANLRVGEVSGKLAKGRHTTRHVELFKLPRGGLLADTPGFNQPDLNCSPEELVHYFPEAKGRLAVASCRFSNCLHRDEPECVVRGDWERYQHYLNFLEEASTRQKLPIPKQILRTINQSADQKKTVKVQHKGSRLVVLSLGQGNLRDGFAAVTAQIGEANNPYQMKLTASLPAAPKIPEIYRNWQLVYFALSQRLRCRDGIEIDAQDDQFEIEEAYVTMFSQVEFANLCQSLSKRINVWLNSMKFRKIDQQLRTQLRPSEEIRFIIETNDNLVRRLPWHLWDFFEDYPLTEVALSSAECQKPNKLSFNSKKSKIRILAILGNSQGINVSRDRIFLEQLSTAEITFLVEPNLGSLNDKLWQQGWDILFFAGYSCSQEKGLLHINQADTITLKQLKYALKQAISRGLKLAIFNSRDGLGLAQQLQDLYIPQVIVMREPVPDVVAQEFLKYFLAEFSSGRSLYAAVRSARERLQGLEAEFPCATWLPVIFQNPAEPPMFWSQESVETECESKTSSLVVASVVPENTPPTKNDIDFFKNTKQDTYPRFPSGSVPLDSPFYIENSAITSQVYQEVSKPGALIRIKAPREMGKTSLLLRVLDYTHRIGYHTVNLNLEQIEQAILSDLNRFLRWLCADITRQLHLESKLDEYWDEDIGSKVSCSLYLRAYVLEQIDSPVVLALDEVNQLFEHPEVAKEVLAVLRSWYEEGKRSPIWQKLRLILVHSTEVYVPLQLHQSPFNVGLPIQLTGLSLDQVQQLAQRYGINWTDAEEERLLMDMVGRHPGLVHLALYHLSRGDRTLTELLDSAPTSSGIYNHHLQRHWATLQEQPELAIALHKVMNATEAVPLEPIQAHKLSSMGLIKLDHNQATPSCQLYRLYFQSKFFIAGT